MTSHAEIIRRLDEMIADPFGRQVLRDLVPRGKRITPALPSERVGSAVRRALDDSDGLPAFLAVGADLVIVVVDADPADPDLLTLRVPGDWGPGKRQTITGDDTLATVIAIHAHGKDSA